MRGRQWGQFLQAVVAPTAGWLWCAAAGLLALATAAGCGSSGPAAVEPDKSSQNLQLISAAYSQAALKLGRPPASAEDLTEFLKNSPGNPDPAAVLRSPNDNENYVIVWGVDFSELARSRGNVDVILAYELRGKNGKRYVLKPPSIVISLTDVEFQAAQFPPGHQPVLPE